MLLVVDWCTRIGDFGQLSETVLTTMNTISIAIGYHHLTSRFEPQRQALIPCHPQPQGLCVECPCRRLDCKISEILRHLLNVVCLLSLPCLLDLRQ
jgi:hypothetical protein